MNVKVKCLQICQWDQPEEIKDEEDDSRDETEHVVCTICLEEMEENEPVPNLVCGHRFHDTCPQGWLAVGSICPVCRQPNPMQEGEIRQVELNLAEAFELLRVIFRRQRSH